MIRCRIPPENSCGYWRKRVGGMPIRPSVSSERRRTSASVELRLVLLQRLAEVVLDPEQRVQPRHRLLEDEAELRAAEPAQLARRHRHEVPAAVEHLTVGRRPLRQQAEDAAAERRLAAAGLADEAEDVARVDLERDAVDGAHLPAGRAVPDPQVADARTGPASAHGSRSSRGRLEASAPRKSTRLERALAQHRVDRLVQALAEQGEPGDEQHDREAREEPRPPDPEAASETARETS